jgi:hypothetical protein
LPALRSNEAIRRLIRCFEAERERLSAHVGWLSHKAERLYHSISPHITAHITQFGNAFGRTGCRQVCRQDFRSPRAEGPAWRSLLTMVVVSLTILYWGWLGLPLTQR